MIRLRLAGGLLASAWVPLRKDMRGDFHAIVEPHHWPEGTEVPNIVVDVTMEEYQNDLDVSGSTAQAS